MFRHSYTTYDVQTNMMRCRITDSDDGDVEILVDIIDGVSNSVIISMAIIKHYSGRGNAGKQLAELVRFFMRYGIEEHTLIRKQDIHCTNVHGWNTIKKQRDECLATIRLLS